MISHIGKTTTSFSSGKLSVVGSELRSRKSRKVTSEDSKTSRLDVYAGSKMSSLTPFSDATVLVSKSLLYW